MLNYAEVNEAQSCMRVLEENGADFVVSMELDYLSISLI